MSICLLSGLIRDFTYLTRPKMSEAQAKEAVDRLGIPERCARFVAEMKRYVDGKEWETAEGPVYTKRCVVRGAWCVVVRGAW